MPDDFHRGLSDEILDMLEEQGRLKPLSEVEDIESAIERVREVFPPGPIRRSVIELLLRTE